MLSAAFAVSPNHRGNATYAFLTVIRTTIETPSEELVSAVEVGAPAPPACLSSSSPQRTTAMARRPTGRQP